MFVYQRGKSTSYWGNRGDIHPTRLVAFHPHASAALARLAWRRPAAGSEFPGPGPVMAVLVNDSKNGFITIAGWWFQTFGLFVHFINGMSSFPLTFIFFKMVETTNQYSRYNQSFL